jgi:hypothetical protein
MRKALIGLALSVLACGGTAAIIATHAAAQAPDQASDQATRPPAQLSQAQPLPPARQLPRMGRGRGAPDPARLAGRREQRCQNAYALAAGRLAYLEARLNLTGAQGPAFNRWRDTRLAAARRRADSCAAAPAGRGGRGANDGATPNPAERLARQETRLQQRLADIQAERPALEALYSSLTPEQRQTLARSAMGARGGMMGRPGMMMRHGGRGRMMLQRGPMGRGPGADGPLPGGSNPPPPQ